MTIPTPKGPPKNGTPTLGLSCAGFAGCTESTGPGGVKIVTYVYDLGAEKGFKINVGAPGDRLLTVSVGNASTLPPVSAAPPLTTAQATAIATEVASKIAA
ncbi:hypothetical protein [Virgisporangium aliadipatigenens]|nr:hypothetical protein [Virgisporangium aliadipatigenens]